MRRVVTCLAAALALALPAVPARAQETIFIPLMTYRTGPFSGYGQHIANGLHDYLTMLNERDGGIGGVRLQVEECETGYDTKKGLECYEAVRGRKPAMVNPWSTGIALPLVPRAAVDRIPMLSTAYGLSAAGRGDLFRGSSNPPDTYWDGMAMILSFIDQQEGGTGNGLAKLKGKRLGYVYLVAGFGKEPIPLLEQLSRSAGFDLNALSGRRRRHAEPVLAVARHPPRRPDYVVLFGWGAMNPTAIKEAIKANYPMEKVIAIWWPSEEDARNAGPGAVGLKTLNWHAAGAGFPAMQDILRLVYDRKLAQGSRDRFGDVLYNRGLYNSVLIAEAIRNAQRITGRAVVVDGADVRRGLESLDITAERWRELGLPDFAGPIALTCADHNGHRPAFMQRWDGQTWAGCRTASSRVPRR